MRRPDLALAGGRASVSNTSASGVQGGAHRRTMAASTPFYSGTGRRPDNPFRTAAPGFIGCQCQTLNAVAHAHAMSRPCTWCESGVQPGRASVVMAVAEKPTHRVFVVSEDFEVSFRLVSGDALRHPVESEHRE